MALIAGNWKMHKDPGETRAFFAALSLEGIDASRELVVFPPCVSLTTASGAPERDPRVQIGVQNIHWAPRGAYTGETSAQMAAAAGATYCLIGHSERRHVFGETDAEVAQKITAARGAGLIPVVCVGETLEERKAERVAEVILRQLDAALPALDVAAERFLLAYEPVWAIGTGETATPEDASEAHAVLRQRLDGAAGATVAARVPILYGGSVKPDNAAALLGAAEVDGVLVGGASLDPDSFARIARASG